MGSSVGIAPGILACGLFNDLTAFGQVLAPGKKDLAYFLTLLKGIPFGTAAAAFALFPLTGLAVSYGWSVSLWTPVSYPG